MDLFNTTATTNEIQYSLDSDYESLVCDFDGDKIEKVINNLLSNAFKHTPHGGKISLSIDKKSEKTVSITIKDNGSGIAPEHLAGVTDRFNNISPASRENMLELESSGIGLSFSNKLIQLHNGTLKVDSEPNKRTQMTIEIPYEMSLAPEPAHASANKPIINIPDAISTPIEESTVNIDLSKAPKLLVVEDDTDLRGYVISILKNIYQVDEASDGQEGLEMAQSNDYDMIISDVMMPNMSGTQLCEQIKTNIKTSHIFVILLTAKSDVQSKTEGYQTGADSYITKPFLPNQLMLVIKNLLKTQHHIKEFYSNTKIENGEEPIGINPKDKQFITEALQVIEDNMSNEQFGVEMLGHELSLSRTHLFRKFKSLTGTGPNDYIRQIRLKNAANLISEGMLSISEIAYKVGFKTPANFSTSFKALYGKSPKEYRESNGLTV
jgi:DNA-binding response OmpR family regulator